MLDPRRIWTSSQLPTLPSVAVRLLDLSKNPQTEIRDVVETIKTDPAITAKILKSANSSFFAFTSQVTSLDRAVPLLGTTVVTSLALSFSLVEASTTSGPIGEHYRSYWAQSLVHGVTAERLGESDGRGLHCEYFLAGLLMDIGRLAMLKTVSKDYLPVLDAAHDQQRALHEVEQELLGIDHVEAGLKLMEMWNLPAPLIAAVGSHHAPLSELLDLPGDGDTALRRALAVSAAVGDYFCSSNKGPTLERLRSLSTEFYGFTPSDLREFLEQTKLRVEEAGDLLSINTEELGDPGDLMAMANEHLAQIALQQHVASAEVAARQEAIEREKRELESKNRQLRKQALHDPLTGTYNRHFFSQALRKEIDRCRRSATPLAVIFADADRFKQLNDTYGHQFGDLVLQRIAKALKEVLRRTDVLARYGGEEFVVLIHQPTEKGLKKVAERLRARVEAEEIDFEGERVPTTISVGAAVDIPQRNDTGLAERLIAAADAAMYESKNNGRNRVCVRSLLGERERRLMKLVTQKRFSRWLVGRRLIDIPTVSKALLQCKTPHVPIGMLAQQKSYLQVEQVEQILREQEQSNERFGSMAMRLGLLTEDQVAQLLAFQQEDPVLLGTTLVRLGLFDRDRGVQLLKEYLAVTPPTPCPQ